MGYSLARALVRCLDSSPSLNDPGRHHPSVLPSPGPSQRPITTSRQKFSIFELSSRGSRAAHVLVWNNFQSSDSFRNIFAFRSASTSTSSQFSVVELTTRRGMRDRLGPPATRNGDRIERAQSKRAQARDGIEEFACRSPYTIRGMCVNCR